MHPGSARCAAASRRASAASPVDERDRRREIAVDGLGADHERARLEPAPAGDAEVQDGGGGPQRERPGRGGRRLDRPDPADEPVPTVELPLGRGDEEDVGHAPILCADALAHSGGLTTASQERHSDGVFINGMNTVIVDPDVVAAARPRGRPLARGRCDGLLLAPPTRCRASLPVRRRTGSRRRRPSARIRVAVAKRPSSSSSASGFSTSRWIARFSGRAPNAGSQPASAISATASSDSSSEILRSASRPRRRSSWSSTIDADLVARQRLEDDDLVDPVHELGPEVLEQLRLRADVRGHDHDRVAEVDRPALAVGQPSVVEQLQEDVEDVGVGLLDLVEQDHAVRPAPHRLGQLPALVVADVAGRRADEARDGVLLHVLRHVEPHDRALVVEHELGERLRELGLADAGRAEEDERADRAVRILQAGARAPQRVRDGVDRRLLADDALVQPLLHVDELLHLALEQPVDGDLRPGGDDGGDVVLVDLLLHHRLDGADGLAALGQLLLERRQQAVADLGDALEVAVALGPLGLHPQLVDLRA